MTNALEQPAPQEDPFAFIQAYRNLKGAKLQQTEHRRQMGSTQMFGVPTIIDWFVDKWDDYIATPEVGELIEKWEEDTITDEEFKTLSGYFLEYCRKSGKPLHHSHDTEFIVEKAA